MLVLGILAVVGALALLPVALGLVATSDGAVVARLRGTPRVVPTVENVVVVKTDYRGPLRVVATAGSCQKIERDIGLAGRPPGWTLQRVLGAKLGLTSAGVLLAVLMITRVPGPAGLLAGGFAVVLGYVVPDTLLRARARERQQTMEYELPDLLDQVMISIEAGLGFEAALSRAASRGRGPLAEEMVRAIQDMALGMSRREAYEALGRRTSVEDLQRFVTSVIQAEEYGVTMSTIVRTQAVEMRTRRSQRAEGKALQVPVKMLFPLIACVLPVLFIVILAPGILNAIASF